jgi:hypothetical protein
VSRPERQTTIIGLIRHLLTLLVVGLWQRFGRTTGELRKLFGRRPTSLKAVLILVLGTVTPRCRYGNCNHGKAHADCSRARDYGQSRVILPL